MVKEGDMARNNKSVMISIRVPIETYTLLESILHAKGITISELVRNLIERYVKENLEN